jgi:hypothetical protein
MFLLRQPDRPLLLPLELPASRFEAPPPSIL